MSMHGMGLEVEVEVEVVVVVKKLVVLSVLEEQMFLILFSEK